MCGGNAGARERGKAQWRRGQAARGLPIVVGITCLVSDDAGLCCYCCYCLPKVVVAGYVAMKGGCMCIYMAIR